MSSGKRGGQGATPAEWTSRLEVPERRVWEITSVSETSEILLDESPGRTEGGDQRYGGGTEAHRAPRVADFKGAW